MIELQVGSGYHARPLRIEHKRITGLRADNS
jgi:hypothetical protein